MKVKKHYTTAAGLSLALLLGISTGASASQTPVDVDVYQIPMHFKFDGKEYAPPEGQMGFIYEGSTYVPIRFISYSLDKAVKWDADTYTVTISEPKEADKVNIKEYKLNTQVYSKSNEKIDKSKLVSSKLNVYKEKVAFIFDGVAKSPSDDLPGYIVDGSLYVPMRFFSESVGKTISWDPETYTVSAVTTPDVKDPEIKVPETPKPDPQAPAAGGGGAIGGGGTGGSGGGNITKPSLDALKSETEAQLRQLQAKSKEELTSLYNQYKNTQDKNLIAEALNKIAETDATFNRLMNDLDTKLTDNGYDTSIINTYKEQYNQIKEDAKNEIISN
ncbi:copper amine oxidase N-terminal domain-containing protein [Paenibacillus sp. WC2504]|uniref:copper amine oxidase N-terminal domain-containing protein n=1 Tax=Paenibacillus sp. WC2504 TaxID=3461403 RepID=UPI0040462B9A